MRKKIDVKEKLYENKEWLYEHYVIQEESALIMAKMAGCGNVTILRWLRKFDISIRTRSEGTFLANKNSLNLSDELSDLLDGELLGDGHAGMMGPRSARYCHTSQYKEYLIWLSKTFADLGIEQSGKINKYWGEDYETFVYKYTSRSYPELVPTRQRFYPEGKKIVPKDLILTPIMARHWFLGDGGLYGQAGGRPHIEFATCYFDKASIDYLLKEFRGKGFKVNHWPSSNKIGMSVKSVKDFLEYIGPCPIDCYSYKWDYQDNRKRAEKSTRLIG